MDIEFAQSPAVQQSDRALAFFLSADDVRAEASLLDELSEGAFSRAVARDRFSGAAEQVLELGTAPLAGAARLFVVGIGPRAECTALILEQAAAVAYASVARSGIAILELQFNGTSSAYAARAAFGARLASYRFDKYRTREPSHEKPSVECVRILCDEPDAARELARDLDVLAEGVFLARDLVSEPPNILHPPEFAAWMESLSSFGLEVEILDGKAMADLGMGALLGVGQGSVRESRLIVLRWQGSDEEGPPLAFVGKGVCFDSGGITLKPGSNMELMKSDMGGAAAVAGLMRTLAARKARVNAVGIIAAVENMPDGNAQRPSDVVTSMSGQTIEIISTDAEGRLILADAVWYCQDRFQPRWIVDIATLTGAVQTALSPELGGLFSNSDPLADELLAAGEEEGEPLWRLPLPSKHERHLKSLIADMKNHADSSLGGGAILGAQFIRRFINGYPWAHLDIAASAWRNPSTVPTVPDGASGFGVRLLNRLVRDYYER